jgi:uncharacterized membrane protein
MSLRLVEIIIDEQRREPLLGPNMGQLLGSALGDGKLLQTSAKTLGFGLVLTFAFAWEKGWDED